MDFSDMQGKQILLKARKHFEIVDPILGKVTKIIGEFELEYKPASFEALVRIIVNQQLSGKAADTIFTRLIQSLPNNNLTPEILLDVGFEKLKRCGLSTAKIGYILGLANYFAESPGFIKELEKMSYNDAFNKLTSFKGFGAWSANIFCMNYLKCFDVFPHGDVSLERAVKLLYGSDKETTVKRIASWSPYRSIASVYLWRWLDGGQPKVV